MSFEHLKRLVAPPDTPTYPHDQSAWTRAEKSVSTSLPSELAVFSKEYGSGTFVGDVTTHLRIANPASPNYLQYIEFELQRLRDARECGSEEDFPFGVFPEDGGLLPIGSDDQSVRVCWETNGDPRVWPIIVLWDWAAGQDGYQRFHTILPDFLVLLFTRRCTLVCWPEPFFRDVIRFEPDALT